MHAGGIGDLLDRCDRPIHPAAQAAVFPAPDGMMQTPVKVRIANPVPKFAGSERKLRGARDP